MVAKKNTKKHIMRGGVYYDIPKRIIINNLGITKIPKALPEVLTNLIRDEGNETHKTQLSIMAEIINKSILESSDSKNNNSDWIDLNGASTSIMKKVEITTPIMKKVENILYYLSANFHIFTTIISDLKCENNDLTVLKTNNKSYPINYYNIDVVLYNDNTQYFITYNLHTKKEGEEGEEEPLVFLQKFIGESLSLQKYNPPKPGSKGKEQKSKGQGQKSKGQGQKSKGQGQKSKRQGQESQGPVHKPGSQGQGPVNGSQVPVPVPVSKSKGHKSKLTKKQKYEQEIDILENDLDSVNRNTTVNINHLNKLIRLNTLIKAKINHEAQLSPNKEEFLKLNAEELSKLETDIKEYEARKPPLIARFRKGLRALTFYDKAPKSVPTPVTP
jgi:hypothetical protein